MVILLNKGTKAGREPVSFVTGFLNPSGTMLFPFPQKPTARLAFPNGLWKKTTFFQVSAHCRTQEQPPLQQVSVTKTTHPALDLRQSSFSTAVHMGIWTLEVAPAQSVVLSISAGLGMDTELAHARQCGNTQPGPWP